MLLKRKNVVFILLAYTFSWSSLLVLNGVSNPLMTVFIIGTWYMAGPLVATLILEKFNRKTLVSYFRVPRKSIRLLISVPLITVFFVCTFLTLVYLFGNLFHLNGVGRMSLNEAELIVRFNELSGQSGHEINDLPPHFDYILIPLILFAAYMGAIVNFPAALGEELGWRGYLFKHNEELGRFRRSIFIGFIWGLWHFPIILKGHSLKENHLLGGILMILFCIVSSFLFNYIREITKSVIAPTLFHGSFNATVPILTLIVIDGKSIINSPVGILGSMTMIIVFTGCQPLEKKKEKTFSSAILNGILKPNLR